MDLHEFISKALLDIISGVEDAQKNTKRGTIPADPENGTLIFKYQFVEFEVSVKVSEQTSGEGKINVGLVNILGAGMKGEINKGEDHDTTLKFKIPIRLPQ